MRPRSNQFRAHLLGATALEAALAMPFFLMGIMALFDIFRYGYVFVVHSFAVSEAADLASKTELEINTDDLSCSTKPENCVEYRSRIRAIQARAEKIANLVSIPFSQDGWFRRYEFDHYFDTHTINAPEDANSIRSSIAILRPGEEVKVASGPADKIDSLFSHPLLPFPGWPTDSGRQWIDILADYPIVIRIQGEFKSLFGMRVPLTVETYAYRSAAQVGHAARPGWGGSQAATATATAWPAGVPTPVPSPTATATITPTPPAAVDCSCCNIAGGCPDPEICYMQCDTQPIGD